MVNLESFLKNVFILKRLTKLRHNKKRDDIKQRLLDASLAFETEIRLRFQNNFITGNK